jgi:uncharacterized protein with PCYCGC motif
MISIRKFMTTAVIFGFSFAGINLVQAQNAPVAQNGQMSPAPASSPSSKPAQTDLPAYHASRPHEPLPETLDSKQFPDAQTQNIYALAAKEKSVLYQQPCYCRCDKEVGHKSLLDCYVDTHAAHCILCKKEAVFAYTETQAGKTAAQIRKEIMDGKWKDIDLSQYDTLTPAQ